MEFRLLTIAGLAATLMLAPNAASAQSSSCHKGVNAEKACGMPCCAKESAKESMPCCAHQHEATLDGIAVFFDMDVHAVRAVANADIPARRTAVVWFDRPVWVGRNVLMGKYVIEHDTNRQARGEPCTYIYAADDMSTPVVTFHCTHLDAPRSDRDTVSVQTLPDGMRKLLQFQFMGEEGAHGYPSH